MALAIRAVIRRLYTHPTTGELVSMDYRARAFPPAMARFLTWRDTSCRGPFCNASIRQHDHVKPSARGGPTSLDNGQDACLHCNQKEEDALEVERVEDPERPGHRVAWTGYGGTTRTTTPSPLVKVPERPAPQAATGTPSTAGGLRAPSTAGGTRTHSTAGGPRVGSRRGRRRPEAASPTRLRTTSAVTTRPEGAERGVIGGALLSRLMR